MVVEVRTTTQDVTEQQAGCNSNPQRLQKLFCSSLYQEYEELKININIIGQPIWRVAQTLVSWNEYLVSGGSEGCREKKTDIPSNFQPQKKFLDNNNDNKFDIFIFQIHTKTATQRDY